MNPTNSSEAGRSRFSPEQVRSVAPALERHTQSLRWDHTRDAKQHSAERRCDYPEWDQHTRRRECRKQACECFWINKRCRHAAEPHGKDRDADAAYQTSELTPSTP